jgi:transposase
VATGDTAEGLVERQLASLHAALAERDAIIAAQAVQLTAQAEQLAAQGAQLTMLNEQLDELKKQLGRNSSNSNLPPSSDGPGAGSRGGIPTKPRVKSGRKRGGQKGRRGSHRALLGSDQVDEFVDL